MSIIFDKALKNTLIVAKVTANNLWNLIVCFNKEFFIFIKN